VSTRVYGNFSHENIETAKAARRLGDLVTKDAEGRIQNPQSAI
jgi:hypothetical protein